MSSFARLLGVRWMCELDVEAEEAGRGREETEADAAAIVLRSLVGRDGEPLDTLGVASFAFDGVEGGVAFTALEALRAAL